jgi:hypothetical protein
VTLQETFYEFINVAV